MDEEGFSLLGSKEVKLTDVISEQATEREGVVSHAPSSDSILLTSDSNPASESGEGGGTGLLLLMGVGERLSCLRLLDWVEFF